MRSVLFLFVAIRRRLSKLRSVDGVHMLPLPIIDGEMEGWMNEWMEADGIRWMDGWMDVWLAVLGWMDGWMDGWKDGRGWGGGGG